MNVIVLNGSPKDICNTVTMKYVEFLEKNFTNHNFTYINITRDIRKLEEDEKERHKIIDKIKVADVVFWGFPVYLGLVPAGYKRFIELIFEHNIAEVFKDKYAVIITTSVHYFDIAAIKYMNAIIDDLNMKYVDYYSAEVLDLTIEEKRNKLYSFGKIVFDNIEHQKHHSYRYNPIIKTVNEYNPKNIEMKINDNGKKIVIVTDSVDLNTNIGKMVNTFVRITNADLINISNIKINGGCIGCMHCVYDGSCIYDGKDDIGKVYEKIRSYDVIVFAGEIKNRYLSARWKLFIDRRFYKNHQPNFEKKQLGYLISGELKQVQDLTDSIQALAEFERCNLVEIVTDEASTSDEIDKNILELAKSLVKCSNMNYVRERTFLGIGGHKVFRDMIWGDYRMMFTSDHRYYRKNKYYDFPQYNYKNRIRNFIMAIFLRIPPIRKKIVDSLGTTVIERLDKKVNKI